MAKFKTAKEMRIEKRQLEITKLEHEQDYMLGELYLAMENEDGKYKLECLGRLSEIHKEIESELLAIEDEKKKPY